MNTNPETAAQWTAIKWSCHARTTVVVDDASAVTGKRVIAECETEQDATLIAAARELLAAAVAARDVLSTAIRANWEGATDDDIKNHVTITRLDAAIAKATGA